MPTRVSKDGTISFKPTDGTLLLGDSLDLAPDDSDASWDGATWTFAADGAAKIADASSTASPGAMAKVVLHPASIPLGSLTKRYDGGSRLLV